MVAAVEKRLNHPNPYAVVMVLLIVSRFMTEVVNTFVFAKSNQLWALGAIVAIAFLAWPVLLLNARRESKIFLNYLPIFAYLIMMFLHTKWGHKFSMKATFSELIVWFTFIFTVELCSRDDHVARMVQFTIILLVKVMVVIGVAQLLFCFVQFRSLNPILVLDARPSRSIFAHTNVTMIVLLPFLFYFIKQRSYFWIAMTMITCIGTGTRSPFFAAACLSPLVFLSFFRIPILFRHVLLTIGFVIVAYTVLLYMNSGGAEYTSFDQHDDRLSTGTLKWRVDHWRDYLRDDDPYAFWLGRTVGEADLWTGRQKYVPEYLPHNDYLKIYFDHGVIGLAVFTTLILYMLLLICRSLTTENDFVLLAFLLICCFFITDNFLYSTMPMWVYMFIGSYLARPSQDMGEIRAAAEAAASASETAEGEELS